MKKAICIAAAIVLLLFGVFWGYLQYQRSVSYNTRIYNGAKVLFRIDVYSIYKSMLSDYFSKTKGKKSAQLKGISIPANVFLYTVSGKQVTTLFASLPVANKEQLEQSLKAGGRFQTLTTTSLGITIMTNVAKNWTIAYDSRTIAFAYSFEREPVQDILLDILQQKNTVPVDKSTFQSIRNEEGHITFLSGDSKGYLNFNKGHVKSVLTIENPGLAIPARVGHRQFEKDIAMGIWLYADPVRLLAGKDYKVDSFTIYGDSLLACGLKGFELELSRPVLQRDSVATYSYNDNFEKELVTTITEHAVPGFNMVLRADAQPLFRYLQRQHIFGDSARVAQAVFPLYQLYAAGNKDYIQLSTRKQGIEQKAEVSSSDFFNLYLNFEKLEKEQELAFLHQYIRPYKKLEAKACLSGAHKIRLEAKLHFKKDDQQALTQLLELF